MAWSGLPKTEGAQYVPERGVTVVRVALQDLETVLTCGWFLLCIRVCLMRRPYPAEVSAGRTDRGPATQCCILWADDISICKARIHDCQRNHGENHSILQEELRAD